jgi:phosphoglycerate dehydrogenase-like enzyme
MIRVGIEESIDKDLLACFSDVEIVRLPAQPVTRTAIDFYVAPLDIAVTRQQWPYLEGVKVVQSIFAGVDVLLKIVSSTVTLCDARGVHDVPISEWAVAAVLAMQKFFPFYLDLQRDHDWKGKTAAEDLYLMQRGTRRDPHSPILVDELEGKTVLILGYGAIGQAIEARLLPFGNRILRVARTARTGVSSVAELDDLLPNADIVISILPGTSETRGLLDARRLGLLKRGALLVNAGRGSSVDTMALTEALNRRHLRAALDVVDPEPLPADHPLWDAPNLLLTSHVAGDSPRFLARAYDLAAKQVRRFVNHQPLENVVTGEY